MQHIARLSREIDRGRAPQGAPSAWIEPATVATVTAAAAADGNALVTVTWRGASQQAAYLSSYAPVVGHVVAVVYQPPGGLLILDRIIGTPPS
jgi:hypothetical protein